MIVRTPDTYFAAFLDVMGFPFVEVTQVKRRLILSFDVGGANELEVMELWRKGHEVPAYPYAQAIRKMKDVIMSAREGGK